MRTPDHVIAEINYRAGGPSTEAPTTCTCGWEGPGSAFAEHRTKATAEDRRAAKEGRTMTPAGPTEKQQQAWDLVTKEGLSQVEAADALGITQGGLQSRLKGYMENQGMKGPLPGLGGAGNGPVRIRRVPPEVLDGPVTTSAPEASSAGAVQAASMGGDAVEPDEGAAPQPPDPTSSDPEPVAETVPSAAGDGATEAPAAPGPTTPLRCAFCGCSEAAPCAEGCSLVPDPQGLGAPCCEACGSRVTAPPRMPWVDDELDRLRGVLAELERREDAVTDLIERLEAVREGYTRLRTLSAA